MVVDSGGSGRGSSTFVVINLYMYFEMQIEKLMKLVFYFV